VLALTLSLLLSQNASFSEQSFTDRVQVVSEQPGFAKRVFGDLLGGTLVAAPLAFVVGKELDGCNGTDCRNLVALTLGIAPLLIAGGEAFGHWFSGGRGSFLSALKGVMIGFLPALAMVLISCATTHREDRPEAVDDVMLPAAGFVTAFAASWFLEVDHSDRVGWW
jgi:hypothetical protein